MDNDYNEYENDIEENYYSSDDEDNKSFYTNNSDSENEISELEEKKNINSEKEDEEENEEEINEDIDEDLEFDEEDSISDEEETIKKKNEEEENNDELIEYKKQIKLYKKNNIEMFSKLGMISYLCNVVDYIKNGGDLIDNRNDVKYPDDTEESYAFESIILDTIPFEYIVNKHLINVPVENKIICLKMALRCVDENKKIFFTKNFTERFPNFKKNLFNNNISLEEIEEIKQNKIKYNIN